MDPKGEAFAALAALVYAAESPISGTYVDQSRVLAACMDTAMYGGGLFGSRVLDVGCGFGTTTLALSRYAPLSITSIDTSAAMIELLKLVFFGGDSIVAHLCRYDAQTKLGEFYAGLVKHLLDMRRAFQFNMFSRLGSALTAEQGSCLELDAKNMQPFDAIAANNMLHWPIKAEQTRRIAEGASEKDAFEGAMNAVFEQLSKALHGGGVCVVVEPKDFMDDDVYPARNRDLETHETMSHPVRRAYETRLNELLLSRHGVKRAMPTTTKLFQVSRLSGLLKHNGLKLESIRCFESVRPGDPFDGFAIRAPMSTGTIDLPIEVKLELGREASRLARQDLEGQSYGPVMDHYFVWIARKR